jgi:hypothetical protein
VIAVGCINVPVMQPHAVINGELFNFNFTFTGDPYAYSSIVLYSRARCR